MPETPKKQYVGPEALVRLVAHLRSGWSRVGHEHNLEDITDYVVDDTLSSSSVNPVQNKVVNLALSENLDAAKFYTDGEVRKLTSGSTPVKEAERADNATMAEEAKVAQLANQATEAVKATKDGQDRDIVNTYETKTDAIAKLNEAKTYADDVKDDLLNGAGPAYDTLKELGELIDDNQDAIAVLNEVAAGKADASHTHAISEVTELQATLDSMQSEIDANESSISIAQTKLATIEEGAQANVQADWNENDETSPAYIQNRPFYTGNPVETTVTLVEEVRIDFADSHTVSDLFAIEFIEGETYTVTWDGTVYNCIAYIAPAPNTPSIGNGDICPGPGGGDGNGEPFFATVYQGTVMLFAQETGIHTISISQTQVIPEIHKIEDKYLVQSDWNVNDPTSAAYVKNRTHWIDDPFEDEVLFESENVEGEEVEIDRIYLFEGEEYRVVFDDIEYTRFAYVEDDLLALGDPNEDPFFIMGEAIENEDSGAPMSLDRSVAGEYSYIYTYTEGSHSIKISHIIRKVHKISEEFLPAGAVIGKIGSCEYSEIFNDYDNNVASGIYSHAEGQGTKAIGRNSHAEGQVTEAIGNNSHAEGRGTNAIGNDSHAEGHGVNANGSYSHAEGYMTRTNDSASHAEGVGTNANRYASHAEGYYTIASSSYQHVQGSYNVEDSNGVYAHIVGNGDKSSNRSNAHTLDWDGNAWYAGTVKVGGTSYADATELLTNTPSSLVNLGMPATATIGQTAVVKTIDENGMPIEWEAADLGNITIDEDGNAWFGTAEEIYKIPEGLPDYTAEDEGKVLSVVDGMAAWTENSGGSSSGGGGIVVSETEPTDESVIFWVQI